MKVVISHIRAFTMAGQAAEVKRSQIDPYFEGISEKAIHQWAESVVRTFDLRGWSYSMASDTFRFEPKVITKTGHTCF